MLPKAGLDVQYVINALQRRFWYVVLPFFLIFLSLVVYCIRAPRVYKATTVILVEPQKVPGEYVSSTVTIDLDSRLRTITPQINSRTRLEKIINDLDLYSKIRSTATMTDAVQTFQQNIDVNVSHDRHAFEVSFQGLNPTKVMDATNTIADLFIQDNLKLREDQAAGTTRFLDRELGKVQETLKQKEEALRKFKEEYRGSLPEDMDRNYAMMAHLQQQADSISTTIQQTKDRKILLDAQLADLRRAAQSRSSRAGAYGLGPIGPGGAGLSGEAPTLEDLRNDLNALKSRYSDKHPDVIKLEATIAKMEKALGAAQQAGRSASGLEDSSETTAPGPAQPLQGVSLLSSQVTELTAQVLGADGELLELIRKHGEIQREMQIYQFNIERAPKIEQMLLDLTRDYDEIQENYGSLLDKKFQATLSENLEMSQQGEQFTILDRAQLPEKPFKPQTKKLLQLGFLVALAGGFGLALVFEYLDPSFFCTKDLEACLQLSVFTSTPVIMTERDQRSLLAKRAVSAVALLSMTAILAYALYYLFMIAPMVKHLPIG